MRRGHSRTVVLGAEGLEALIGALQVFPASFELLERGAKLLVGCPRVHDDTEPLLRRLERERCSHGMRQLATDATVIRR